MVNFRTRALQRLRGKAIRSQAWPGNGGQEGSETSGVSPNNNPRRERPASSHTAIIMTDGSWNQMAAPR